MHPVLPQVREVLQEAVAADVLAVVEEAAAVEGGDDCVWLKRFKFFKVLKLFKLLNLFIGSRFVILT
jgi:hypothetical protein